MTINKAITYLFDFYNQAKDNNYIQKPIALSKEKSRK